MRFPSRIFHIREGRTIFVRHCWVEHSDKRYYGGAYDRGAELIKDYVSNLSEKSGVYRMIGENDKVLYVGKAKNLRARVISYTRPNGLNNLSLIHI